MSGFSALDHGFTENPKVMKLHDRAFRLYVIALDQCSRNMTDGHVSERSVKVCAAILNSTARRWWTDLVKAGLLNHDEDGDGFWINDYLSHNPSGAAMKQLKKKRRVAGLAGAEARWRGDGKSHGKPHGKKQMPAEQSSVLDQDRSRQAFQRRRAVEGVDSLPVDIDKELLVARLIERIGDHADTGTVSVIRSYVPDLPPAAFAKVIESIDMNTPRNRAAYAVAALRDESSAAA